MTAKPPLSCYFHLLAMSSRMPIYIHHEFLGRGLKPLSLWRWNTANVADIELRKKAKQPTQFCFFYKGLALV